MDPLPTVVFINNCLRFIPITLLIYDWALTLDDEIDLIWRRSSGFLKLAFLALRYGPLVPVSLAVFGFVHVSDRCYIMSYQSKVTESRLPPSYRIQTDINLAMIICMLALVQILLQVRVYVMYNKSRTILWTNAVLFAIEHAMFISLSLHFAPQITAVGGCRACSIFPRSFALAYLAPLCYEAYLVFLAARKSRSYLSNSRRLGRPSTLSVLVRGSVQYFVLVTSGMGISVVLFLAAPRYVLWVDLLTDATASLGGTRLILSVRKAFVDPGRLSEGETAQTTLYGDPGLDKDLPSHESGPSTLA